MVLKILVPIISSIVISLVISIMSLHDDKITYWDEWFVDERLYSQGETLHDKYLTIKDEYTQGIISNEEFVSELKELHPKVESHAKDLENQIFFLLPKFGRCFR